MKAENQTSPKTNSTKTIVVAPLHWGLGHATRCIPIIRALLKNRFDVILASDGAALELLKKEFPQLETLELPGFDVRYSKNTTLFKWNLLLKLPRILKTVRAEKRLMEKLVSSRKIDGIISDNRPGVRSPKVPSVYITHQLNVLSGKTSVFSSKIHQKIIKKFDECWVPDVEDVFNLSGKLGHPKNLGFPVKYIGILSRMQKNPSEKKFDVLAILSGPEPQRTLLEERLISELKGTVYQVLLVRGIVEPNQKFTKTENIMSVNFLKSQALETAINESEMVVCRSGYTSIMDLAMMEKDAFFIPTPGQYEQEYLAKRLKNFGMVPSCKQARFKARKLNQIKLYSGLKAFKNEPDFEELFGLFQSK